MTMAANNKNPEVSVIIPAYCAAEHLHIAIESLQAQTFGDFEIIVVEDCSPDDGATMKEALRLAALDPRIIVTRTPVNSGAGVARNVALDMARGRYVTFLDADDTLAPEALENLTGLARLHNADMVCFTMEVPGGKGHAEGMQGTHEEVCTTPEEITELALNVFSPSVGHGRKRMHMPTISRLIRRSLLDDNHIRFPSDHHFLSEDNLFAFDSMRCSRVFVYTPHSYYRYLQRPGSTTHSQRPDMIERTVESAERFAALLRADKSLPGYAVENAWGYALMGVRSYVKEMFMSGRSMRYKRRWLRRQASLPLFRTIYEHYPWREMPFKHRLGFIAFYRRRFLLLYILVVGQEKARSLLRRR